MIDYAAVVSPVSALPLPTSAAMVNFFMVGSERVTWELVSVREAGMCRLAISHAGGTIVEYFPTTQAALERASEIEAMMTGSSISDKAHAS